MWITQLYRQMLPKHVVPANLHQSTRMVEIKEDCGIFLLKNVGFYKCRKWLKILLKYQKLLHFGIRHKDWNLLWHGYSYQIIHLFRQCFHGYFQKKTYLHHIRCLLQAHLAYHLLPFLRRIPLHLHQGEPCSNKAWRIRSGLVQW